MKLDNPFPLFGYFGADYFCDRKSETKKLEEALLNGRNVTLIAPRRLGKTGLIHHVLADLGEKGEARSVYLDIFAVKTMPEFVQAFARAVFSSLETRLERATSAAGRFLSGCRPSISIDSVTGSPSLSFTVENAEAERTLKDVFAYLASQKGRIVIALDEFQQVAEFPEKGTEALMRSYIQFLPNVRFVFSGSKEHMMTEMFLSAARPFYKSTQNMSLKPIDREAYYRFAEVFFKRRGQSLDEKVFGFAYDLVEGVTWELQYILNRLWSQNENIVGESLVRAVVDEILSENEDEYATLVSNLTVNEAKVLRNVARHRRVTSPTASVFVAETGIAPSSVKLAVDNLVKMQHLARDKGEVFVADRFFGLWLGR